MATLMLHESSDENRQPWLCLDIDVSWNYSFEWVILYCCCFKNYNEFQLNRLMHLFVIKTLFNYSVFIHQIDTKYKNTNWNCLWMILILTHIYNQTVCVWFIDWWVNEARRQKRKDQCPRQSGMHWTNERFFEARCYTLID